MGNERYIKVNGPTAIFSVHVVSFNYAKVNMVLETLIAVQQY